MHFFFHPLQHFQLHGAINGRVALAAELAIYAVGFRLAIYPLVQRHTPFVMISAA